MNSKTLNNSDHFVSSEDQNAIKYLLCSICGEPVRIEIAKIYNHNIECDNCHSLIEQINPAKQIQVVQALPAETPLEKMGRTMDFPSKFKENFRMLQMHGTNKKD